MFFLRIILIVINVCLLGFVLFMTFVEFPSDGDYIEILFVLGLNLLLICNLIYLVNSGGKSGDSYFSLMIKRKKMEEKRRIKELCE